MKFWGTQFNPLHVDMLLSPSGMFFPLFLFLDNSVILEDVVPAGPCPAPSPPHPPLTPDLCIQGPSPWAPPTLAPP